MKSNLKEELLIDAVYDETSLELMRMIIGEDIKGDIPEKITDCIKDSLKKSVEHVQEIDNNTNEYFEILDDDTLHERIGKATSSNALLFIKRRAKA